MSNPNQTQGQPNQTPSQKPGQQTQTPVRSQASKAAEVIVRASNSRTRAGVRPDRRPCRKARRAAGFHCPTTVME